MIALIIIGSILLYLLIAWGFSYPAAYFEAYWDREVSRRREECHDKRWNFMLSFFWPISVVGIPLAATIHKLSTLDITSPADVYESRFNKTRDKALR